MSEAQSMENTETLTETKTVLVTVGSYSRALIRRAAENKMALSNEDLAAKVVAKFKAHGVEVQTSAASIAWYKNDMRKKGQLPKTGAGRKSIELNLEDIELSA